MCLNLNGELTFYSDNPNSMEISASPKKQKHIPFIRKSAIQTRPFIRVWLGNVSNLFGGPFYVRINDKI